MNDLKINSNGQPESTPAGQIPVTKMLGRKVTNTAEWSSSGTKLLDKIMSRLEDDFMEQLEAHLIGNASHIANVKQVHSNFVQMHALDQTNKSGPEAEQGEEIENVIQAACSKKVIGSLVLAFENTNNERFLAQTYEWLEASPARKNNYPIAVKSLTNQPSEEEAKAVKSIRFLEQPPLSDELSKVATFKCQEKSNYYWFYPRAKGTSCVQFDKESMMACTADGTLHLRNLGEREEESIKVAVRVKNITCFHYDKEIVVLGTAQGTLYLFDGKTFEEKWSVRLGEPIRSLKFAESTIVVQTGTSYSVKIWWVDISRSAMRLLNQRSVRGWSSSKCSGVSIDPDYSFLYHFSLVLVYDTKSGEQITEAYGSHWPCSLEAPNAITTLSVVDLISTKRVVVAGCYLGMIVMWDTGKFTHKQVPVKVFEEHMPEAVVSVCELNGHLLSLNLKGKLLMWSGHDLENKNVKPVPRLLLESSSMTSIVAHERWFASSSSKDDTINIWTLPDLWLRTG